MASGLKQYVQQDMQHPKVGEKQGPAESQHQAYELGKYLSTCKGIPVIHRNLTPLGVAKPMEKAQVGDAAVTDLG